MWRRNVAIPLPGHLTSPSPVGASYQNEGYTHEESVLTNLAALVSLIIST